MLIVERLVQPRLVTPGAMVALTRRTTHRCAFLAPWDPRVGEGWLYSLAGAQHETRLAVHQTVLVANHHHSTVTPRDRELAAATRSAHRDMSFCVNELLIDRKRPLARAVFDPRQTNWTTCVDVEAEIKRILYDAMNAVAAGLVERPEEMPWGHYLGFDYWLKGPITVKRPALRHFRHRPRELTLTLTPPAKLYRAFRGDVPKLVEYLHEELEHQIADVASKRNKPARGLEELLRIDPWNKPKTLSEARWQRVPTWAVGAEGEVGKERRIRSALEVHGHRADNRDRIRQWKDGDKTSPAPHASLWLRVFHKLELAETGPDNLLCASYPTLDEVKAELAAERAREAKEQRAAERRRAEARKAHKLAKRAAHRAKQRAARRDERQKARRAREEEAAEREATRRADGPRAAYAPRERALAPKADVDVDVLASLTTTTDSRREPDDVTTPTRDPRSGSADADTDDDHGSADRERRSGDPPD